MTILRSNQDSLSNIVKYKGMRFNTKLLFVLFFCIFFGSGFSTYAQNGVDLINKEEAREIILPIVEEIWAGADQTKDFRVNQYGLLLPEGTQVKPAFITEGEELVPLVCNNPCWLFFVDMDPKAHFAHHSRIILLDAVTSEQQTMESNWWPYIYGPNIEDKPIFHKVEERNDQETIIFEKEAVPNIVYKTIKRRSILSLANDQTETYNPCEAWAIIVCGYDDLPDTFDEDTDGMNNVLSLLGIPDDHIFFLSPHTSHTGVDQPTSIANVQWAINQVATQAVETDQVLFFYSSHGDINSLSCVPYSPGGGSISATNLDNWLDAINCWELTVIIEACHSGSLIGLYADGTYVAAEDELTGDGETNRAIFTSASTDTSSYGDKDGPDDPNPSDSGSETIWGYVEAFSTISADLNIDGEISFNEGWLYAWYNDVTRIRGWNTPQMVHTGLDPDNVYHICKNNPPICDINDFYTAECQGLKTTLMLDGTSSSDPDVGDTLVYYWTTDCPGGSFDDPVSQTPILTVDTSPGCLVTCNVTLSVTDSVGFSDSCSATVTISDNIAPEIICPSNITLEQTSADGTPVELGNPTVSDDCDIDPEVMNNAPAVFPLGGTIVTWTATDDCGNSSTCPQTITVVDTTPPTITCPSDITAEQTSADGTPVDMGNPIVADICDTDPDVTNNAPAVFPLGDTVVTWTVTDASGNSSSCTQTITVVDTTPPTITCPSDITAEQTSADGTPVDIGNPIVIDICDADPDVTNNAPALFPLGDTVVTWTATDASGNSSSCTQKVTVVDTTPPVIHSVSASPDSLWSPNHKMVPVTVTCVCEDICDIAPVCIIISVESNQPVNDLGDGNTDPDWEITGDLTVDLRAERSGTIKEDRIYTITVECTDFSGNSSTATVNVIVKHDQGKKSAQNNQVTNSNRVLNSIMRLSDPFTQSNSTIPVINQVPQKNQGNSYNSFQYNGFSVLNTFMPGFIVFPPFVPLKQQTSFANGIDALDYSLGNHWGWNMNYYNPYRNPIFGFSFESKNLILPY